MGKKMVVVAGVVKNVSFTALHRRRKSPNFFEGVRALIESCDWLDATALATLSSP